MNKIPVRKKNRNFEFALLSIIGVVVILGLVSSLFVMSYSSDIVGETKLDENKANTLQNSLEDILYMQVNDNDYVYCPFKSGNDDDDDGVDNFCDNCPLHYNPEQFDNDLDKEGNECDAYPNNAPSNGNGGLIACSANIDCGVNGFVGSSMCSSSNVVQTYRTFACSNAGTRQSTCSSTTQEIVTQQCSQGCSNGQCINTPPTPVTYQCNDGIDNDGDTLIDYSADPGCENRLDNDEYNVVVPSQPQCNDGIDNDGDGKIDYPADSQCDNRIDNSE